jgi:hypothetical protein
MPHITIEEYLPPSENIIPREIDYAFSLGTTVSVAGRNETGDAAFSGQVGEVVLSNYVDGIGASYSIAFGEVVEENISESMLTISV